MDLPLILGIAGIAATVIIALIIYFLQRPIKKLQYETIQIGVLTKSEKLEGKIKVLFENEEVEEIVIFQAKLVNTGNRAISPSDFETPIKFHFASRILSSEITKTYPDELTAKLINEGDGVTITPTLLNPKDGIDFKVILEGATLFSIESRIKDIPEITQLIPKRSYSLWITGIFLLLSVIFIFIGNRIVLTVPIVINRSTIIGMAFLTATGISMGIKMFTDFRDSKTKPFWKPW